MKREYRLYIDDILEAVEKIEKYVKGLSSDEFIEDGKTVDAVIRNFQIIGEATKRIPDEVKRKYADIPWKEMAGMRDKLVHEYFGVKLDVLWKTIKNRLPELKALIKEVLEKMNKEIGEDQNWKSEELGDKGDLLGNVTNHEKTSFHRVLGFWDWWEEENSG
jgi:uncharacterized protein with HEPN domain